MTGQWGLNTDQEIYRQTLELRWSVPAVNAPPSIWRATYCPLILSYFFIIHSIYRISASPLSYASVKLNCRQNIRSDVLLVAGHRH